MVCEMTQCVEWYIKPYYTYSYLVCKYIMLALNFEASPSGLLANKTT